MKARRFILNTGSLYRKPRLIAMGLALITATTCTVYAHQPQDGEIRATGALYLHRNVVRDHAFSPQWQTGGGLIVEGDIDHHGGLELSAFYMRQFYSIQEDGRVLNTTGKRMYVVMGYRHWWTSRFSMAGGFYSSYAMGGPRVVYSEFPPGQNPRTSASDPTDYGFDFSAQFEPISSKWWSIVVDARYSRSVTNKPGEAADFYGAVVGLKYLVQQRSPTRDRL
jgi:hypothetical protein